MAKENRRKNLIATVLILTLMTFSAYAALVPSAHATEATLQDKGLSTLNNVVGIDTAKYSVTTKQQQDTSFSYLGVVPIETVAYDLTSENSKMKALYTFANGKIQMIQVLENEGEPLTKLATSTNTVEMAKAFLNNYEKYAANMLFGELRATLNTVIPDKNLTKTVGNTMLEVTTNDGFTSFKWYYTANGAVAPYSKFVTLGFKDGFLEMFVDNWQLYNVGSTNINLSKEEAISIALETAKEYSWSLKLEADALNVNNFNESNVRWASLVFDNSLNTNETRSEDTLELYPVWRVGIALNKWYGQMYGIEVDIWADTKEVRSVQEAWSTLPPPEGVPIAYAGQVATVQSNLLLWIGLPMVVTISGISVAWQVRQKHSKHLSLKPRFIKSVGTLLCICYYL